MTHNMESRLHKARGKNVEIYRADRKIPFVGVLELGTDGSFIISSNSRGRPAIILPEEVIRLSILSDKEMEQRRKDLQRERLAKRAAETNGVPVSDIQRLRDLLDDMLERAALADRDS